MSFKTCFKTLLIALLLLSPISVMAVDRPLKELLEKGIYFYDPFAEVCETDSDFSGSDNVEIAFNFFVSKGLTTEQAAGIVGNLMHESGVNPEAVNDSSGAFGIAQWLGGRDDNLRNFAKATNRSYKSLEVQLEFIWFELTGDPPTKGAIGGAENAAYKALIKTKTPAEAAKVFEETYERSGGAGIDDRIKNAEAVFKLYGDAILSGAGGGGCPSVGVVGCGGTTTSPLPPNLNPAWFNAHNHGTSVSYPTKTNGHNTVVYKSNNFGASSVANSDFSVGEAVDVGASAGTEVFAPFDGKILYAGTIHAGGADGYMIVIESTDKNCVSNLAHLQNLTIKVGDNVKAGDKIGRLTSLSADHLHFELWMGGEPINIGKDNSPCPTGGDPCDNFSDEAAEIWQKQKAALTGGTP